MSLPKKFLNILRNSFFLLMAGALLLAVFHYTFSPEVIVSPVGLFSKPDFEYNVDKCVGENGRKKAIDIHLNNINLYRKQIKISKLEYNSDIRQIYKEEKILNIQNSEFSDIWKENRIRSIKDTKFSYEINSKILIESISKSEDKLSEIKRYSDISYCIRKFYVEPFRTFHETNVRYSFRSYFFDEDKTHWENLFVKKYGEKEFELAIWDSSKNKSDNSDTQKKGKNPIDRTQPIPMK